MKRINVENLIDGLCLIPEEDFTCDNVYQFLGENPVEVDSISRFFHWSDHCYTRNLIYKDARFEMMAICWETRPGLARSQSFRAAMLDDRSGGQTARAEFRGRGDR